jgi:parallel beta-helix repeat protein
MKNLNQFLLSKTLLGSSIVLAAGLAGCGGGGSGTDSAGTAAGSPASTIASTLEQVHTESASVPSAAAPVSADSAATPQPSGAPATPGTSTPGTSAPTPTPVVRPPTSAPITTPTPTPAASLPALALPAVIANGSTVTLECGRTYLGTLDLKGKSNVTVNVSGSCGKPTITPAKAVSGWTKHQGNIWSAPIAFATAQVIVDEKPVPLAHWPNKSQGLAKAASSGSSSLAYAMPNADLAGANLIFKPYEWSVEARRISAYANGSMTLAATDNPNYDGYALSGRPEFYVEGKLWMLDEPNEWAIQDGRLYVWTADGQSPEGRVAAAPNQHGIDAENARNITVQGVRIAAAANGIHASGATSLRATDVEIINSSGNGIMNSGGSGLYVDGASIRNSRHDGIIVKWGGGNETIKNSSVDASGTTGMPVNAHAAISLTMTEGATITNNRVTNAAYTGIRFYRNATVTGNTVDGACLMLSDCGGLYTAARDKQPLNTRIESNVIQNVGKGVRLAWGIFLDDFANGVTVSGNTVAGSGNGLFIHNGFGNLIQGNAFSASSQSHLQMYESAAGAVKNNTVSGNTFTARNGEETYRISSDMGTSAVAGFAAWNNNVYASSSAVFANFNGEQLNFAQWKSRTGQDGASVLKAP